MSEQTRQDLEAVYDLLEARGWCKTLSEASDGSVCLEGACAAVTMGSALYWDSREGWNGDLDSASLDEGLHRHNVLIRALRAQIPESQSRYAREWSDHLPRYSSSHPDNSVWWWNDMKTRTVDEVKDLIRAAIKAETT